MVVSTPPSKHVKPLSSIPPDGSGINPHGAAVFKMLNISSCFTWRRFFSPGTGGKTVTQRIKHDWFLTVENRGLTWFKLV